MAVKLRLTRVGKKKQPQYRIVAADTRSPRDGRFIEILGHYDPRPNPSKLTVHREKVDKWLAEGAQPSERVAKLLKIDEENRAAAPVDDATGDDATVRAETDSSAAAETAAEA